MSLWVNCMNVSSILTDMSHSHGSGGVSEAVRPSIPIGDSMRNPWAGRGTRFRNQEALIVNDGIIPNFPCHPRGKRKSRNFELGSKSAILVQSDDICTFR